jgi:hypothetical protein
MNKLSNKFKLMIAICAFSLPTISFAQFGPGFGDESPCSGENNIDDVGCPFDGGVSLLVAAGVAYGIKKANNKKNNKIWFN